nr:hypothetical protein [Tanacetum cinerariifolium]
IVKLLNLKGKYGASDKFYTELLELLKKMLPTGNEMVENLSGQKTNKNDGIKIQKDTYLQAWCTIDEKFPKIAKDPINQRLGISADEVDVNSGTRHHRDTQEMISMFLELLVDDLHTLFETGVDTYDTSIKENFNIQKNVCESLVRTFLNAPGKTKDGMSARLDLAKLGIKLELFVRQEEDKTTLPPVGKKSACKN